MKSSAAQRFIAMKLLRFSQLALSVLLIVIAAGCAHYKLGPTNGLAAGAKSIEIRYFKNEALEPRLVEVLDHSLKRGIQRDGTLWLETHDKADYIMTGEIISLNRMALSFDPGDTLTARDYQITLNAHVIVKERITGKIVVDRNVSGRTNIRIGSDQSSAERMAAPMAAETLAYNIVSSVVDGEF